MSAPRDRKKLAAAFTAPEATSRIRFGQVVSVSPTTGTCTITIAGASSQVSGVKYLKEPVAGLPCIIMTDGADMFVLGQAGVPSASIPTITATVRRTTDTALNNTAAGVVVTFQSVENDTLSQWSAGSPTILTIQRAGTYLFTASVSISGVATPTGYRGLWIQRNGADLARAQVMTITTSSIPTKLTIASPATVCAVGDTITLTAMQTHSGGLTLQGGTAGAVWLSAMRIGE